jgi:hypothetical protein
MRVSSMKKIITRRLLLFFAAASCVSAISAGVYEPFDYSIELQTPEGVAESGFIYLPEMESGSGWLSDSRKMGWRAANFQNFPPGRIIGDESLSSPIVSLEQTAGRSLSNQTECPFLIFARWIDLYGEFLPMALEGRGSESQTEGSVMGIGRGGETIWFSFLVKPSGQDRTIFSLNDSATNQAPSGFSLNWDPQKKSLTARNARNDLPAGSIARASAELHDFTETAWLVGKVTFGAGWGADIAADSDAKPWDKGEPDGSVVIWLNPSLEGPPEESSAFLQLPVYEFRFDRILLQLGRESAFDEIRLGTSFESVVPQ